MDSSWHLTAEACTKCGSVSVSGTSVNHYKKPVTPCFFVMFGGVTLTKYCNTVIHVAIISNNKKSKGKRLSAITDKNNFSKKGIEQLLYVADLAKNIHSCNTRTTSIKTIKINN